MGGKQALKVEGYCNRNWLFKLFQPPVERGSLQAQVIKQTMSSAHQLFGPHKNSRFQVFQCSDVELQCRYEILIQILVR